MDERISDKISQIEQYVEELYKIVPSEPEQYCHDCKTKAACERYFEKILEAVVDLAFLVVKKHGMKIPKEDTEVFQILLEKQIISAELATRLKQAKAMRNFISHQYSKIDDQFVFETIRNELKKDIEDFVRAIAKL